MRYEAKTLSATNIISTVVLDARDEQDARRQIEALALQTVSIKRVRPAQTPQLSASKRFSLLLFSQELLALVKAGLGLFEAIEALREKETAPETCGILDRLLAALREGRRFSAALSEQANHFPPLYIGLMQAAEGTSDLPRSLGRFVDYQKRVDSIRTKVVSASIYPLVLITVGFAVTVFLLCYVVPRFALVYQDSGRELPWLSQRMLDWGQLAAQHTWVVLGAVLAIAIFATGGVRRLIQTGGLARIASQLPTIGYHLQLYELSRLYLTLGMLLEGGIPATHALATARSTVSVDSRKRLMSAETEIRDGRALSTAFEGNGLTTTISLRMLRVGEQSGQLGAMLTQAAEFYDGDVIRFIDRFMRAFEPVLMAIIGLIVGLIVVLLYMPIFDLAGSLQ
ncbi:type II secretion system F family protein [Ralstonia sp. CHL-2022]|uniref:Type II secretion system F family protein n=1 Tax=Ralstonia mojiangensis TaxID=2953895 RepID=A0ABT2LD40_9RALS|nr:type II secretion system F family protein [Ralstonia mojiangensis]MCT7313301.1 type II secretion system F family protein [Ralstonia mojiangensis]